MKLARDFLFGALLGLSGIQQAVSDCSPLPACDYIGTYTNEPGGVDPNDQSLIGIYQFACPCNSGDALSLTLVYTGIDNAVTTEYATTALGAPSQATSFPFAFTGTNQNVMPGSQVTQSYDNRYGQFAALSFTYSPVTSIFYSATTTTVTTVQPVTTTQTVTSTSTSTTTLPQSTSTIPCTTGASTNVQTTTVTTTTTITPSPKIYTFPAIAITTTQASCVSAFTKTPRRRSNDGPVVNLMPRQEVNQGIVETPWFSYYFGSPASTTFYTSTAVQTATITSTETDTATVTQSTTSTVSLTTSTVCSNVEASTTITNTVTKTSSTTLKRKTSTTYSTTTFIITEYARFPPLPCPTQCTSTVLKAQRAPQFLGVQHH